MLAHHGVDISPPVDRIRPPLSSDDGQNDDSDIDHSSEEACIAPFCHVTLLGDEASNVAEGGTWFTVEAAGVATGEGAAGESVESMFDSVEGQS